MIALLDCNNFYISCERLFDRKLINKPVVVLSNNDGCVISRSNEAKKLGILMGEPFFKIKKKINNLKISVCSSNYALYGDISGRVMKIIKNHCFDSEIYSIDEAFINLEKMEDYEYFCYNLKRKILKSTGIPVSVGIAPTKTLSKIANKIAKASEIKNTKIRYKGIYKINLNENLDYILKSINIEDIWGIGRKLSKFFRENGLKNAYELKNINTRFIRQEKGVLLERTILELKGIKCYEVLESNKTKKSICVSRSFGQVLLEYKDIREALIAYVLKASEKLRKLRLYCGIITVFLKTSSYKKKYYKNTISYKLKEPTSDSRKIWIESDNLLKKLYLKGYEFNKVGIILSDLREKNQIQNYLFKDYERNDKKHCEDSVKLMKVIDKINIRFGEGMIRLSSDSGVAFNRVSKIGISKKKWSMKSDFSSPCYTTKWSDIPSVIIN